MAERIKHNSNAGYRPNYYFWRSYSQKEVDLVEEYGGVMNAYEFKWGNNKQSRLPKEFASLYPDNTFTEVNRDNYRARLLS